MQKYNANNKTKWFEENCFKAKQDFKTVRNVFLRNKTDENRILLFLP